MSSGAMYIGVPTFDVAGDVLSFCINFSLSVHWSPLQTPSISSAAKMADWPCLLPALSLAFRSAMQISHLGVPKVTDLQQRSCSILTIPIQQQILELQVSTANTLQLSLL